MKIREACFARRTNSKLLVHLIDFIVWKLVLLDKVVHFIPVGTKCTSCAPNARAFSIVFV